MKEKTNHLRCSHKRLLAALLTVVMLFSLMPTAFAAQENGYHDPAEHWLTANNRTNELDANAVVTRETFNCGECGKPTSFEVFRTPEYTRNGQTAMTRNVKYSNGMSADGETLGTILDGTPGVDAYDAPEFECDNVREMSKYINGIAHELENDIIPAFVTEKQAVAQYIARRCGERTTAVYTATRSGSYSFDGWYTAASGGTKITTDSVFSKNTTVYAHWTYTGGSSSGGGVSTYAITVDSAKNGDVTSSHKNAAKGTTITLTVEPDKGYTLETITATDASGNKLKLTEKDGKYTFTMPASKVTVKATFMEDNSMLNFFVDVPADAYYYDAVLWAAEEGITGGVDATHFAPNATCTRAQAVTFLWRAAGSPAPKSSDMPFTDVAEGSYYYDAVLWAVENGITKGTSDTTFTPNAKCTRAQIVTFLWRSQKSPASDSVNPFTDVAADAYYSSAVLWAVENGITAGTTATTFSPNNDCTRAQIVTFLFRCLGK